jgi:hypothetical protein
VDERDFGQQRDQPRIGITKAAGTPASSSQAASSFQNEIT